MCNSEPIYDRPHVNFMMSLDEFEELRTFVIRDKIYIFKIVIDV